MIIIRILGGLGNQMFCYATARRLALVNNVPLKLDTVSGFRYDYHYNRKYCLNQFNIKGEIATPRECFDDMGGRIRRKFTRMINRYGKLENKTYIAEIYERKDPNFVKHFINLKVDRDLYLEGNWGDEDFYKDIEEVIRDDFKIVTEFGADTLIDSEMIMSKKTPICIGVRRFEEVKKIGIHKEVPINYYKKAIDHIIERVDNPHFFIFSSDIEWAKNSLKLNHSHTYIKPKTGNERAFEDLWLITICKHFIISNSTYYFWGAWLSNNKEKIVIVPGESNKADEYNCYLNNWIRIYYEQENRNELPRYS